VFGGPKDYLISTMLEKKYKHYDNINFYNFIYFFVHHGKENVPSVNNIVDK
jgi:hypothetical protein